MSYPEKRRLGFITFKKMSPQDQERLLAQIEAALLSNARRGLRQLDLEEIVMDELGVAQRLVQKVSDSKAFKVKLQMRRM